MSIENNTQEPNSLNSMEGVGNGVQLESESIKDKMLEIGLTIADEKMLLDSRECAKDYELYIDDRYYLDQAAKALGVADAEDRLIEIGDTFLKKGDYHNAIKFYGKVKLLRKEEMMEWADSVFKSHKLGEHTKGFEQAGANFRPDEIKDAISVYSVAGAKDKLIELGDWLRDVHDDNLTIEIYEKAGANDKLIELGDRRVSNSNFDGAMKAYEKAGAKDKLIELGDRLVKSKWFDDALNAYEKARQLV